MGDLFKDQAIPSEDNLRLGAQDRATGDVLRRRLLKGHKRLEHGREEDQIQTRRF